MKIQSRGFEITTEELRADVEAAKNKGPYWASAFCLETVEALLDLLDLYAQQNQDNAEENKKLREANRKQWERIVELEAGVGDLVDDVAICEAVLEGRDDLIEQLEATK